MRCNELHHRAYGDQSPHIGWDCECYVRVQNYDGHQAIIGEGISTKVIPMESVMLLGGYMSDYDCMFFRFGRNGPMDMKTFQQQFSWYDPEHQSTVCNECVKDMLRKGEIRCVGDYIEGPYMCDCCDQVFEDDPPYEVNEDDGQLVLRECEQYDYSYHCKAQTPPLWFQRNHVLCPSCFERERTSFEKKDRVRLNVQRESMEWNDPESQNETQDTDADNCAMEQDSE